MARAGAVKAGEAYVEVFSDDTPLVRGMKGLGAKLQKTGSGIQSIGASAARAGAGIAAMGAAVVGPLAAAVKSFTSAGDELQKMGLRLNASTEFLSELGFAAEQSGTSLKAVSDAMFRANRRIANAATEAGPAQRALELLGLEAEKLNRLPTDKKFLALADALSKMENETLAAQLGFEIFGDNFKQIKPLIDEGAVGISNLQREARKLGITFKQDDAEAAAAFGDALNRIKRVGVAAFQKLGAAIAPALGTAAEIIKNIVSRATHWIDQNRELVVLIAAVGTATVGIGTGLAVMGAGIGAIGTAVIFLKTAVVAVAGVVGAISAPAAAVALGVVAIGAGIAYVASEAGLLGPAFDFLKESFGRVSATFKKTFGGIVQALRGGEFKAAAQIAWSGVKLATLQGAQEVLKGISALWNNAGQITERFFGSLIDVVWRVFKSIPKIAISALSGGAAIAQALQGALSGAFSGNLDLAGTLDPSIASAQQELNRRLGQLQQRQRQQQRRNAAPVPAAAPNLVPARFRQPGLFQALNIPQPGAPAVQQRQTAAAGAAPQFGDLVALTRRQVALLSQIAGQGGLA